MEKTDPRAMAPPGVPHGARLAALTTPRWMMVGCDSNGKAQLNAARLKRIRDTVPSAQSAPPGSLRRFKSWIRA